MFLCLSDVMTYIFNIYKGFSHTHKSMYSHAGRIWSWERKSSLRSTHWCTWHLWWSTLALSKVTSVKPGVIEDKPLREETFHIYVKFDSHHLIFPCVNHMRSWLSTRPCPLYFLIHFVFVCYFSQTLFDDPFSEVHQICYAPFSSASFPLTLPCDFPAPLPHYVRQKFHLSLPQLKHVLLEAFK